MKKFWRREPRAHRAAYSAWDGSQKGFDLDADALFEELTDDLLYHGDLNAALRRLMQDGLRDRDGNRIEGLRELLDKLKKRRQEELDKHNLGGVYDDIADKLREVMDKEHESLTELGEEAAASDDARRKEITEQVVQEKRMEMAMMPPDLAGLTKALQEYEFTSSEARQQFEELMDELRKQLMDSMFQGMSEAMQNVSPEEMARMKDMLAGLNEMMEKRANGEDPGFEKFMEEFGDFFPGNPETLDELLEQMAQQMAAMQAMMNSMSPEQRQQLQQLSDALMEDMDLRWQMDQLSQNLQQAFPGAGWDRSYNFQGQDPLDMSGAADLMSQLGDMDSLREMLQGARNPGALAEVDIDRARELLGDESAESLERLGELAEMLENAGYLEQKEGRLELTPRGMRQIGQNALGELFEKLSADKLGKHELEQSGAGHEREYSTKPYEWGDPFNLDIQRTVRNAIRRTGGGTPVQLTPEDFEVERTEQVVRSSTVLMLDLSLSMPMRDNFLPAKKVAMALYSLMSSQFPRDYLGMVGFSRSAREIRPADLPEVSWDYEYGTNMQHGLLIARRLLAKQWGTKQIIMITDGEPTAHFEPGMREPFFSYPPVRPTVEATLKEVARCTKENIRINTFMLDADAHLKMFVEKMTEMNRGRAFFTTPDTLGDYVLVDFLESRKTQRRVS